MMKKTTLQTGVGAVIWTGAQETIKNAVKTITKITETVTLTIETFDPTIIITVGALEETGKISPEKTETMIQSTRISQAEAIISLTGIIFHPVRAVRSKNLLLTLSLKSNIDTLAILIDIFMN